MIRFDHLKLVARHPTEMARFRRWVLGGSPGNLDRIVVEHENDGRCCRKEAWNDTATAIITALEPATPQVFINVNRPGARP